MQIGFQYEKRDNLIAYFAVGMTNSRWVVLMDQDIIFYSEHHLLLIFYPHSSFSRQFYLTCVIYANLLVV